MFSGILEGMETFRIPNSTPNAVPGRAQGLADRIAGAFRALLMDGNAETIPNPPSSRPPARPFPSSSRNRLRSWLPEGFDSVCWPEQCPPLFKPCVPGKKGRKASFIPPSGLLRERNPWHTPSPSLPRGKNASRMPWFSGRPVQI